MIKTFYEKFVLSHPIKILFSVFIVIAIFAYGATKLEIDASSSTLLLEDDPDLLFSKEVTQKFKTQNILAVAFTPNTPLLSKESLDSIRKLTKELLTLEKISSVTSILNVPLLQSSHKSIKNLVGNIPTLESKNINLDLVKKEFLTSPIYKSNLVSNNFKTTAIIINLKDDKKLSKEPEKLKKQRDFIREANHIFIQNVREILHNNKNSGELFLGGVNMISDDLINFVKNDLIIYGTALLTLLIFILWLIFREIRWIVLPVIICLFSIVTTAGLLGFFGWEVTVISSNFVSLQLIITMSITLHLMVRYNELLHVELNYSQKELILETVLSKLSPSFFAILTTIVGFASLIFSNILPIINLGWMMSSGIAISLVLSFILFPAILVLLPVSKKRTLKEKKTALPELFAKCVEFKGKQILFVCILIIVFSLTGVKQLIVENSFINYFKSSTEIYKGMKVIDKQLGGTTPLDIIVKFNKKEETKQISNDDFDEFDSFEDEFDEKEDSNQYWFTPDKMELITKIHNYLDQKVEIGNVQSLATTLSIGKLLNDGKELNSFELALLYKKLPDNFKKIILEPYISIKDNEVRFATRIIDSNPELRRNQLIKEIDAELKNIIKPEVASYRLSNIMILYNNMLQSLFKSQILTLGLVLILLFLMFLFIFKSLKIALIAIISNIIPMSMIFGFMGWFGIPLDMMTITIAAISLGIGVDDTIHYIHRFYEELKIDNNYVKAMHRSHNSIGYAMYYTTLAIMLGFSVLVLSNFLPTIYFGILTMTVMFMALLGALLLLPKLLLIFKPKRLV
ncbi:efflux RND transporter permease subunit [Sulfurospirillum arcachonense]|uniref:efflux RND transporter permease subunit n=1 Tax=Sulfurospirillum arcachonense TaxID=57666 RepID=UPI000469F0E7|nr:MMPL family transporter [Sulfurospirillum arcachonense]